MKVKNLRVKMVADVNHFQIKLEEAQKKLQIYDLELRMSQMEKALHRAHSVVYALSQICSEYCPDFKSDPSCWAAREFVIQFESLGLDENKKGD